MTCSRSCRPYHTNQIATSPEISRLRNGGNADLFYPTCERMLDAEAGSRPSLSAAHIATTCPGIGRVQYGGALQPHLNPRNRAQSNFLPQHPKWTPQHVSPQAKKCYGFAVFCQGSRWAGGGCCAPRRGGARAPRGSPGGVSEAGARAGPHPA